MRARMTSVSELVFQSLCFRGNTGSARSRRGSFSTAYLTYYVRDLLNFAYDNNMLSIHRVLHALRALRLIGPKWIAFEQTTRARASCSLAAAGRKLDARASSAQGLHDWDQNTKN